MIESGATFDGNDTSTLSGLTSTEHSASGRLSSSDSMTNSIVPRSSLERRISDHTDGMSISKLKFEKLPLIGRDKTLQDLTNAIQNVLSGDFSRGLVLIHGESGIGKTSLITHSEIQKQVRRNGGLFTLGKAELSEQQSLASVQDALNLLSYQILQLPSEKQADHSMTKSTASINIQSHNSASSISSSAGATSVTLEQVQDKLLHDLDASEWRLLIETVPALESIMMRRLGSIGISSTNMATEGYANSSGASFKETSDRLKYVYRHFVRVVSSVCPLVLVLDDCQWADEASIDWIKGLLSVTSSGTTTTTNDTDCSGVGVQETPVPESTSTKESSAFLTDENGCIVVIATYRTEEVGEDHALSKMVKNLRSMLPSDGSDDANDDDRKILLLINDLAVSPLSLDQVNDMLSDLLRLPHDETVDLAKAVHQKSE